MTKVLIVGGVAGGMSAAARLRRLNETAEITVFERGDYVSFANCGLPYHIGEVIKERDDLLLQTPESFYARFRVNVRTKSEVISIDRANKTVTVRRGDGGSTYQESYDRLILSPGAEPIRPPLSGIEHPAIFTLRTIPDTDAIKHFIQVKKPRRALVVGGGFIGLEMAENLHLLGIQVTIVEQAPQVMTAVDFELAAILHQHMKSKNVDLKLATSVMSFANNDGKVSVMLSNGQNLTTDLVILSIGVRPDVKLARDAGIAIGQSGGIIVNDFLQTNDPDIYAAGDAIESPHEVYGDSVLIPLGGPANKQGRLIAENIANANCIQTPKVVGTAIAKVFDLSVAGVGASEKMCRAKGIPFEYSLVHVGHHAGYYPGAMPMTVKLLFSPDDGRILGGAAVGIHAVDRTIDVIALAVQQKMTVRDLEEFEHAYAPPFSSAKDPVNVAAFVAGNILAKRMPSVHYDEIAKHRESGTVLLDVRTAEEHSFGAIPSSLNVPIDDLRARINEIPQNRPIVIYCAVGLRGYLATRILLQSGFEQVWNLSGGYKTYSMATRSLEEMSAVVDSNESSGSDAPIGHALPRDHVAEVERIVDACGLQCPGPIQRLKKAFDETPSGGRLCIKASDPGFYTDVAAWARVTGNRLLSLKNEKGIISAQIEKTAIKDEMAIAAHSVAANDKTIVVFSGELDKVIAAFIISNGALSMGRKVTLFFTFWGVAALRRSDNGAVSEKTLMERMFSWMLPKGSRRLPLSQMNMMGIGPRMIRDLMLNKRVGTLEEMIKNAIDGGANLVACQMSMDLLGIRAEELIDGVKIGGVASYLEAAEKSDTNLFI